MKREKIVAKDPNAYPYYQYLMRKKHNVVEGEDVTIYHVMPISECAPVGRRPRSVVTARVESVHRHFIVLRFPKRLVPGVHLG